MRPGTATSPTSSDWWGPGTSSWSTPPGCSRPASRPGESTGGAAEVLLLEPRDEAHVRWEALVRPSRKVRPGHEAAPSATDLTVVVGEDLGEGRRLVDVEVPDGADVLAMLERHGTVPLPPYITTALADPERYQTTYADRPASVAAPTAGLHLTPAAPGRGARHRRPGRCPWSSTSGWAPSARSRRIRSRTTTCTASGTRVPEATMAACEAADRVVAIGTTTVRALESAAATGALAGRTELFIHGDRPFALVGALLTNFHQPRSSLLVLVEAFVGPRWRSLYDDALGAGYRFLSFGDAMFLRGERG